GSDDLHFLWSHQPVDTNSSYIFPLTSGTYSVAVTDSLTLQTESTSFQVNLISIPTPIIVLVNDTLMVQTGYTYQWYLNGNLISGANDYFYLPTVNGDYSVEIINGICTNTSNIFSY